MKYSTTYIQVSNFEESVAFYEAVMQTTAEIYAPGRWASFDGFHLYAPQYDIDNKVARTSLDTELVHGTSVVIELYSEDLENDHQRLKALPVPEISEITFVNVTAPYHYFHFKDLDGNLIEVSHMDE